jgi:hypothetical protein
LQDTGPVTMRHGKKGTEVEILCQHHEIVRARLQRCFWIGRVGWPHSGPVNRVESREG